MEVRNLSPVHQVNKSALKDLGDRGIGRVTLHLTQPQIPQDVGGQAARQMVAALQGQGREGTGVEVRGRRGAMETVIQPHTKWTALQAVKAKEQTEVSMCQNTQPNRRPPKAK